MEGKEEGEEGRPAGELGLFTLGPWMSKGLFVPFFGLFGCNSAAVSNDGKS